MRRKGHFDLGGRKLTGPGYARPSGGIRKVVFIVFFLGGGWFIMSHFFSLPSKQPEVARYEVLAIH